MLLVSYSLFFFFNDTATTEIYTLSLHDALPIWTRRGLLRVKRSWMNRLKVASVSTLSGQKKRSDAMLSTAPPDRKSTRLNSSHSQISYAVFCLKKKKSYIQVVRPMPHTTKRCLC